VIQLTPQMRILVAVEPQDFRRGIDGLARLCRDVLAADPFSGAWFVFRNPARHRAQMPGLRWPRVLVGAQPKVFTLHPSCPIGAA
jgi:transposase